MWSPLPAMLAFVHWMLLYLTTKSQLQERWYFADLAWRSTLFINRKNCVFPSLKDAIFIKPESLWVQLENSWLHFVSLVTLPISQPSHTMYTNWLKNIHSNSGPSLGNISHIHEWERHHGEGCRRRPRFLVKCEWHSLWYLTSVPWAISLSDQGRRLHESWYLYWESSGTARDHLLIAKRHESFYLGQSYFNGVK